MIPIEQYIGELRQREVRLWLEGDKLGYQAPKGTLNPTDIAELRARKQDLIAFLRESSAGTAPPPLTAAPRSQHIPQSFAQRRLWFLFQLTGPDPAYNIVDRRRLTGPLDRAALEASFHQLARRHEILRTTFGTHNGQPVQRISETPQLDFRYIESGDLHQIAITEATRCFDLTTGPLLSVCLLRLAADEHALLLTAHHIICDGWSLGILFRELSILYRSFRRGEPSPLSPPALHYADYAIWQHAWLGGPTLQARLEHWRHLAGAPPVLDLFPDHPRPARQTTQGAAEPVRIEPGLAQQFKRICQASGCTTFMGMLALFQALLARYTHSRDIVLGTQVAGRDRKDIEPIVGFMVNTLALRTTVHPENSFAQLLTTVRQSALDAIANQDAPFDKVVEMLQPERIPGRNPLVQVMLLWQNAPIGGLDFDSLHIEPIEAAGRTTAKFDLTLEMGEVSGAFDGVFEYRTDLYTQAEIRRLAGHLRTLMAAVSADPHRPLSAMRMLPEAERNTLLTFGRGEAQPACQEQTLAARFEQQARLHPVRPAVVFGESSLTYAELDARATRLAASLQTLGVKPEHPVALLFDPSLELIVAMLGVLKAGGCYLPLDTRSPKARLDVMLRDSAPRVILTTGALIPLLPETSARVQCVDRELPEPSTTPASTTLPGNLAYIIYTSGSTGTPKGVMVEHHSVLNLAAWLGREAFGPLQAPVHTALLASAAFDASVQQIFGCLLNGHTLYPVDSATRRDGIALRNFFHRHQIALADCTPSLLSIMCDAGIPASEQLSLRCILVGGEALPNSLLAEFYRQDRNHRIAIHNVYGPTECCVDSTSLLVPTSAHTGAVASIGRGVPNSEIFILDEHGRPVPEGVTGEICIAGEGVGRGYWNRPSLTAAAFVPHPFRAGERMYRTGDRGYWNAEGLIEFLGRNDDQVKVRGHRIQLGDIETHLARHPHVRHAVVVARPELTAYLVAHASVTVAELRSHLAQSLPEYMIPAAFVVLDSLPLNASGKVDRKRLPDPTVSQLAAQGTEHIAPRTPGEIALAKIWSEVLTRPLIGIRDHYISLGGDSIKALQIAAKLRDAGWKLELSDLFLHPHIEDLAPLLKPLDSQHTTIPGTGSAPLTPVQLRFFETFHGNLHHFNQSTLLTPCEALDEAHLHHALNAVYRHHDMLRARFEKHPTGWRQYIPEPTQSADLHTIECQLADIPAHAATIQAGLQLHTGPLFKATLFRTPHGQRLLLVAHHLIIDGVSWRILLTEIERAYSQSKASQPIQLSARTSPFKQWAEHLHAHSSISEPWPDEATLRAAALTPDHNAPPCPSSACAVHSLRLTSQLTGNTLEHCHRAYGTEVNDILLTALARALRRHTGNHTCAILLEGHGRQPLAENIDISQTIGWFTAIYPVVLDIGADQDPGRSIKLIKETLRAIPHKGLGYGIRRYIARDLAHTIEPGIVFNYLGQFSQAPHTSLFTPASENHGPMADPNATFPHDLEINGLVLGATLEFHLSYNPNRFRHTTIANIATHFKEELESVTAHAISRAGQELTPSDIDYDGFNLDEMESFLNNLSEKGIR